MTKQRKPKTFKAPSGRATVISMLGDDHDYSTDDPEELEQLFSDMGEIVDGQKQKAEGLSTTESQSSGKGGGGRNEGPPPKAA